MFNKILIKKNLYFYIDLLLMLGLLLVVVVFFFINLGILFL